MVCARGALFLPRVQDHQGPGDQAGEDQGIPGQRPKADDHLAAALHLRQAPHRALRQSGAER